jgi:hypothetical protein
MEVPTGRLRLNVQREHILRRRNLIRLLVHNWRLEDQLPEIRNGVCHGSANENRRGANQCTVLDLPHKEVRDIRTADRAEPPVV